MSRSTPGLGDISCRYSSKAISYIAIPKDTSPGTLPEMMSIFKLDGSQAVAPQVVYGGPPAPT